MASRKLSVLVVIMMAGCPGPKDDDLGDEIWTVSGGLRDQCDYPALSRNGMRLEFREYVDCEVAVSRTGRLTDAGLAEYIEASVPLSPGTLSSCLATDGVDAIALAFDGTESFEVRYCAGSSEHDAWRLKAFLDTVRAGLEKCESHEWFDAC